MPFIRKRKKIIIKVLNITHPLKGHYIWVNRVKLSSLKLNFKNITKTFCLTIKNIFND